MISVAVFENVEKIRQARGVTKTYLAHKLGLSLQGYRHIMSGQTRLDTERLKIIALVLGVKPAIFFNDKLTKSVITRLEIMLNSNLGGSSDGA
ncbi:helix-turn-helix domain-containing protein [Anaeroselena agilis]|uniref:helix-turn-helix domain-containing protein n=1 Tax=Anaeroselena agilis TaxID=3063788 RepID=UPI0039B6F2E9